MFEEILKMMKASSEAHRKLVESQSGLNAKFTDMMESQIRLIGSLVPLVANINERLTRLEGHTGSGNGASEPAR